MSPGTFSRRAWSLTTIYIFARVRIKKDGPLSDRPVKFHDSFYKLLHFFLLPAIFVQAMQIGTDLSPSSCFPTIPSF